MTVFCSIAILGFLIILSFSTTRIDKINGSLGAGKEQHCDDTISANSGHGERRRPFAMPLQGDRYRIFQPLYDLDQTALGLPLFASPQRFVETFSKRLEWLKTITPRDNSDKKNLPISQRAQEMYLEFIKSSVTATAFNDAELTVSPGRQYLVSNFNANMRKGGTDWTYLGDTMTGSKRIQNVWDLLSTVSREKIPGDYIETGVWRGGSSVFARAVMNVLGEVDRVSYVCDSFAGLPPGDRSLDRKDKGWDLMSGYLAVSEYVVAGNFQKYGLLDSNVVFAKGFFNDTMPPLSKHVKQFAVMRLDGDMYESTVDVLYHMYDKLSIGGFLIMDDWFGFPSRTACEDFFTVHGIQPKILPIDSYSIYWKKEEEIEIQYWRYEQNKFKPGDTKSDKN